MTTLLENLEAAEGRRHLAYRDGKKLWTAGVGRLIDQTLDGGLSPDEIALLLQNPKRKPCADAVRYAYQECPDFWAVPLSDAEVNYLLTNDVKEKAGDCRRLFPNFEDFSQSQQDALIELMFNLGYGHLSSYHVFCSQVLAQDWGGVQDNMRGWQKWFNDVKPARANRIIEALGG